MSTGALQPKSIEEDANEISKTKSEVDLSLNEKRVGPCGYSLPPQFELLAPHLAAFQPRLTDTWVVTFPRSGTTITQEMAWLITNNFDFETAKQKFMEERFPYFEMDLLYPDEKIKLLKNAVASDEKKVVLIEKILSINHRNLEEISGPRFIKTHLPFSLLPSNLLEVGAKVIYVARNPKDVAVSCYYYSKMSSLFGFKSDFGSFWDAFQQNEIIFTPFWSHVKEAWRLKSNPNLLFLFYEEINKDIKGTINKVSEFLIGKRLTDEDTDRLADHLSIDSFRDNRSVNKIEIREAGLPIAGEGNFIRKGVTGGWVDEFTPELTEQADQWIEENLKDTDLSFPN